MSPAPPLRSRTIRCLVAISASAIAVAAGCGLPADYDQRGGEAIAAEIRASGSQLIEDVQYLEGDMLDAASVNVFLRPGTPKAAATALVCDVVVPAIRGGDPPEQFSVWLWDGDVVIATDRSDCRGEP